MQLHFGNSGNCVVPTNGEYYKVVFMKTIVLTLFATTYFLRCI